MNEKRPARVWNGTRPDNSRGAIYYIILLIMKPWRSGGRGFCAHKQVVYECFASGSRVQNERWNGYIVLREEQVHQLHTRDARRIGEELLD